MGQPVYGRGCASGGTLMSGGVTCVMTSARVVGCSVGAGWGRCGIWCAVRSCRARPRRVLSHLTITLNLGRSVLAKRRKREGDAHSIESKALDLVQHLRQATLAETLLRSLDQACVPGRVDSGPRKTDTLTCGEFRTSGKSLRPDRQGLVGLKVGEHSSHIVCSHPNPFSMPNLQQRPGTHATRCP